MKINFTRLMRPVGASLLAFSALTFLSSAAMAAEAETAPLATNLIMEAGLSADAMVPNVPISVEAKRLPLSVLLNQVQEQSKVGLTIAPDTFPSEPKVTLAVAQMPLREWMDALAKLYDVRWAATGENKFELRTAGRTVEARDLRRMGPEYNYWGRSYMQNQRPEYLPPRAQPAFKNLVDDNLDLEALNKTGVAWKDVSPELQKAVRENVEHQIAFEWLLDALATDVAHGPLTVNFAKPPGGLGLTAGKKTMFTPFPVEAMVNGRYGVNVLKIDMVPSRRGRQFLQNQSVSAAQAPTVNGVVQPLPQ